MSISQISPSEVPRFVAVAAQQLPSQDGLHHRIASALQVSLEPEQLAGIFAREVRAYVPCDSVTYANKAEGIYAADGKNRRHQCVYNLSLNGQSLGKLHFTRSRRFREEELLVLEELLRGFLYPIRNALLYREAQRAATTDRLTGLKNRAAFDDRFQKDIERSSRYGIPLSLLMIDVDNFKTVNDTYGHAMGDRLLRALAQVMLNSVRKADEAFRFGGDEFVIMLPSTGLNGAGRVAERLQQAAGKSSVMAELAPVSSSLSIGIATFRSGESALAFIDRADASLYQAKTGGRNRVCLG